MSARARAALGERDQNHVEITQAYEELLCLVADTSKVGGGFPDILVRIPTRTGVQLHLVEIKTEDGTLNPAQATFHRLWGGYVVTTVRSPDEVIRHVRRVQDRCRE